MSRSRFEPVTSKTLVRYVAAWANLLGLTAFWETRFSTLYTRSIARIESCVLATANWNTTKEYRPKIHTQYFQFAQISSPTFRPLQLRCFFPFSGNGLPDLFHPTLCLPCCRLPVPYLEHIYTIFQNSNLPSASRSSHGLFQTYIVFLKNCLLTYRFRICIIKTGVTCT